MNLEQTVLQVHIEDIIPNRFQPRLNFDEQGLQELAASIKEHGIIQPLVLRKLGDKYEIIAGERRYKAAQIAGLTTVPAVIANIDDNKSAEVALVENVQRRDLTAIEEARSYKNLLDKGYLTQEQLAKRMGLSQPAVANKLRLLNLDVEVQQALLEEKISERHARTLLTLPLEEQREWLHRIINERLTVRQLDIELKKVKGISLDEDENEGGDVPLVKTIPSIEDIKANAMDIRDFNATQTEELETNDLMMEEPVQAPEPPRFEEPIRPMPQPEPIRPIQPEPMMPQRPIGEFTTTQNNQPIEISAPHSTNNMVPDMNMPPQNNKFFGSRPENTPQEPVFTALGGDNGNMPPMGNNNTGAVTNEFEVFDANPNINQNPFVDAGSFVAPPPKPAPEFNKPTEIIKPEFNSQINPTAQMEINPNNKFFTPITKQTSDMATIVTPNVNNTDVDPMAAVDRIGKSDAEMQAEERDLKYAIDGVRAQIDKLGNEGFFIDVEEIDFPEAYQITMRIHKDN